MDSIETKDRANDDLWLEQVEGEKALAWVRDQNSATVKHIGHGPLTKTSLYADVLAAFNSKDRIPHVRALQIEGKTRYYNFWEDEIFPRGVWRWCTPASFELASPEWNILVDVDLLGNNDGKSWVWKGVTYNEPSSTTGNSDLCMIAVSDGGTDAVVYFEFSLVSSAFLRKDLDTPVVVPNGKTSVHYKDTNTLYVGLADAGLPEADVTDSGYARTVREVRRLSDNLSDLTQSEIVFQGEATDISVSGWTQDERSRGGYVYDVFHRQKSFFESHYHVLTGDKTDSKQGTHVRLDIPADATVTFVGANALVSLRSDWKQWSAGSLLSFVADDLIGHLSENVVQVQVVFDGGQNRKESLQGFTSTQNYLVLTLTEDVLQKNRIFKQTKTMGRRWSLIGDTDRSIHSVSVSAFNKRHSDSVWVTLSGFTRPGDLFLIKDPSLLLTLASQPDLFEPPLKRRVGLWKDPSTIPNVSQHFATSADGTRVPYFQIGAPAKINDPVLLYGYGGFEVSLLPWYSSVRAVWLRLGGTIVVANIRGGEYGPEWHKAGSAQNREKAYQDFEAVAIDLTAERKVTASYHLGIQGGSNGGLLVANAVLRRPDLYGAVVCQVPLTDMQRYTMLLAGASWVEEYGDPDDPEVWTWLQKFSPYHQTPQASAAALPPILVTTSTKDDRVHPGHARRWVHKLQREGHRPVVYFENEEGGHSGGADNSQYAKSVTLSTLFLLKSLGTSGLESV